MSSRRENICRRLAIRTARALSHEASESFESSARTSTCDPMRSQFLREILPDSADDRTDLKLADGPSRHTPATTGGASRTSPEAGGHCCSIVAFLIYERFGNTDTR